MTKKHSPGPAPQTLKIDGDWKAAVARMLRVPTPPKADPPKPQRKKPKS